MIRLRRTKAQLGRHTGETKNKEQESMEVLHGPAGFFTACANGTWGA
jgi:hypothetical protein